MIEADVGVMCFEDRNRGHVSRNVYGSWKSQGDRFFARASRWNAGLDFSPIRLISYSSLPKL